MTEEQDKVVELEMRISVIEQAFDDLSDMVNKQWNTIDALKAKLGNLESQIEGKQDRTDGANLEQPPPHY